ncbi:cytochrome b-c1 complex subunit 10 [Drosophila innubila]|uniref:cytochrome b-c1 complex subunit 10 n=1 Tax=Drosophila innubila TaxID=198719 RepID=UPI00148D6F15|nr:cytochrome b-c1 complex subunit 10 [Drosophila innubila]
MNFKKLLTSLSPTKGQKEMAMAFVPTAATFGMAGLLTLIYFTDWRLVTNYIPLYNTKYPKEPQK